MTQQVRSGQPVKFPKLMEENSKEGLLNLS